MRYQYLILALFLAGCGRIETSPDSMNNIKQRVHQLEVIASSLDAAINSDFSTCSGSNASDAFINKVCNIAKAATAEQFTELKAELAVYSQNLQGEINSINTNLVSNQASIDLLNSQIATVNSTLSSLDTRMTSVESAVAALQAVTSAINGTLAGNMITLDIGSENLAAGPLYETVLRRNDKKRYNGYVQAYGTPNFLGSNPINATNNSSIVTVTAATHGYLVGDVVTLSGLVGSRGFSNGMLYGDFTVLSVPTVNTFTIALSGTATSGGTLGGSAGMVQKVQGRGMGTLWKSGDASDVAVRVSNLGTKRYNFIIRRIASDVSNSTGELCYDTTNNLATFGTINAAAEGGSGNIVCK
jgi:hypothetical protein